ncbi:hypothetical protein ABE65_019145 [Fictibacillus phosphorivorans]|uniref:Uncharacterized protein n=1 Tax=Fictibacillus phosphorivorans TaxID=1221500 RepID=A0A160IQP5_9BACL|nr:oligosaccharide flippase family protein [Fictibacillus phosphorivorans]ANC78798.1 hypothetical protein ABE65_019145 [Fictibacillus phosphorivorans]
MKKIILFIIPNMLSRAISLFMFPFFTYYLKPEDYGILNISILLATGFIAIDALSINMHIYKTIKEKEDNYILKLRIGYTGTFLFSLIILICCIVNIYVFSTDSYLIVGWLFIVYFIDMYLCSYYRDFYRATNNEVKFAISELIKILVYPITTLIFLSHYDLGLYSVILGNFCALIINGLYNIISTGTFFLENVFIGFNKNLSYLKEVYLYTFPFSIHAIFNLFLSGVDKFLISLFGGNELVGIYASALTIAGLLNVVAIALNNYLVGNLISTKNVVDFQKPIFIYSKCLLLTAFCILTMSSSFFENFLSNDYVLAVPYINLLLIGQFFLALHYLPLNIQSIILLKTKVIPVAIFIATIFNITLNLIFLPHYGLMAAAIISSVSYVVLFFILYIFTRRKINYKIFDREFFINLIFYLVLYLLIDLTLTTDLIGFILRSFITLIIIVITIIYNIKYKKIV